MLEMVQKGMNKQLENGRQGNTVSFGYRTFGVDAIRQPYRACCQAFGIARVVADHEAKARDLAVIVTAFILVIADPYEGGDKANGKKESC